MVDAKYSTDAVSSSKAELMKYFTIITLEKTADFFDLTVDLS